MKLLLIIIMSLRAIADRFEEDEGNVFSLYEREWTTVNFFFSKLWIRMKNEGYTFRNTDFHIPIDPSELHPSILGAFVIGVRHMITSTKCDLDCIDDKTWEYLRDTMFRNNFIIRA